MMITRLYRACRPEGFCTYTQDDPTWGRVINAQHSLSGEAAASRQDRREEGGLQDGSEEKQREVASDTEGPSRGGLEAGAWWRRGGGRQQQQGALLDDVCVWRRGGPWCTP